MNATAAVSYRSRSCRILHIDAIVFSPHSFTIDGSFGAIAIAPEIAISTQAYVRQNLTIIWISFHDGTSTFHP